jgi:SRSO17 transposase
MCQRYSHHFVQQGMNSVEQARHYLGGLLGTQRRKNIETIHLDGAPSDYQSLEQFISASPWDHQAVLDQVAREADVLLGDVSTTGLFIDESSFLKKGKASVGVQRQWSGRAGKIENCQVGVFAGLGQGSNLVLTDFRLYLPASWVEDEARCRKAKVPEEKRQYQAKWQLALEMIRHARQLGLRYGWVGMDSLYGSNAGLLNELEDLGEHFLADVSKVTKVWDRPPSLQEPEAAPSGRGRPRQQARLQPGEEARYRSVEQLTEESFASEHRALCYRQGHKGQLWAHVWVRPVWVWEKGWEKVRPRMLVVRRDADGTFKYSLTNSLNQGSWERYAWMQGQRFFIEHAFHEAKSQLGMAQYQVRVWRGWHHHQSLVCLALLLSIRLQRETAPQVPLLSLRDITELLDHYLPRQGVSEAEVLSRIRQRHRQRQQDLDRRKLHRSGLPPSLTK